MSRHTLGHIYAKLNSRRRMQTTFVIVEGADDLAFYHRFFDGRVTDVYYSTKLDDQGNVKEYALTFPHGLNRQPDYLWLQIKNGVRNE